MKREYCNIFFIADPFHERITQKENNVTKAFVNVFMHSSENILHYFLRKVLEPTGINILFTSKIYFELQKRKFNDTTPLHKLILGISPDGKCDIDYLKNKNKKRNPLIK